MNRTHRLIAPFLIAAVLALAGPPALAGSPALAAASSTTTAPATLSADCAVGEPVAIASHTVTPSDVAPGESSVEQVTLVNCLRQAVVETVSFSGQWLVDGVPTSLPGCGATDQPHQVVVSFAPHATVRTTFGIDVPATCTATSYTAKVSVGSSSTSSVQLRTMPPACSASVTYRAALNSFYLGVTVTNLTTTTLYSWTAGVTLAGDDGITIAWNATATQSGNLVTATNISFNGTVAPGGTVSFGAMGNWTVTGGTAPTAVTFGRHLCTLTLT